MSKRDIVDEGSSIGIDQFFKMAATISKRIGKSVLGRAGRTTSQKRTTSGRGGGGGKP